MEKKKYIKKPVVIEAYVTDKEIVIHTLANQIYFGKHTKNGKNNL